MGATRKKSVTQGCPKSPPPPQLWDAAGMKRSTWYRAGKPSTKPEKTYAGKIPHRVVAEVAGRSVRSQQRLGRIAKLADLLDRWDLVEALGLGAISIAAAEKVLLASAIKLAITVRRDGVEALTPGQAELLAIAGELGKVRVRQRRLDGKPIVKHPRPQPELVVLPQDDAGTRLRVGLSAIESSEPSAEEIRNVVDLLGQKARQWSKRLAGEVVR